MCFFTTYLPSDLKWQSIFKQQFMQQIFKCACTCFWGRGIKHFMLLIFTFYSYKFTMIYLRRRATFTTVSPYLIQRYVMNRKKHFCTAGWILRPDGFYGRMVFTVYSIELRRTYITCDSFIFVNFFYGQMFFTAGWFLRVISQGNYYSKI